MKHSRRPFPVLQCCQCVNVSLFQFRDRTRRGPRAGAAETGGEADLTSRKCRDARDSRPPPDVHLRRGAKTSGTTLPGRTDGSPGIRRGSWGTQDGTAGRRSCLNAVFRALYVAEENYEVRTRKTHTGLGGNAILRFSSGNSGRPSRVHDGPLGYWRISVRVHLRNSI